jgi:polar amino acid transport system substrate-binding protein
MVNDKPFNVKGYGFAVKKGQNSELLEKFDAGLANIKKSGELKKILAKYGY